MNKTTKPKKAKHLAAQIITKPENLIIVPDILPPLDLIQKANQNLYNQDTGEFNCSPLNYLLAGLRE